MSASLDDEKAADERQDNMKVPTRSDSGDQEALAHHSTYLEDGGAHLTPEHREYLLKRHGTLSLDPLPSADPADPYNWPSWKVSPLNMSAQEQNADRPAPEKHQPDPGCIPRHDDHLHRSRYHSGF